MKRSALGFLSFSLVAVFAVGCGDDGGGGSEAADDTAGTDDEVGTDDTDDTETGSGSAEDTTETTEEGPPPDEDMDEVPDADDNCPSVANPNQLDFDGNGVGNACEVMTFAMGGGTLASTATADAGLLGSCEIPIDFMVTGGEVQVEMDDNASVVRVELVSIDIADVLDQVCNLGIVNPVVSLTMINMANDGDAFPVNFGTNQGDHDAGVATGTTNIPHPVLTTAIIDAKVNPDDRPMPSDLDLPGAVPFFDVDIQGAGATMDLTWSDTNFTIATDVFEVEAIGQMIEIDFELKGLSGTVSMTP
ncbi:hypothetical protein PPSIR1_29508 [Plesiocystis pacifica SIR-1]|uniref:Lipoprotein n=1 Tax=Plesiocystis pacifica SIR-1 TaxID=391625 RepID=A6G669_9BACT|nr:hypothetical protein [Plesiocystis pacifica]EDM78671.1 hypothetical protein PPSIR1_29508 [Plesiocystis pacifica SIR-1]